MRWLPVPRQDGHLCEGKCSRASHIGNIARTAYPRSEKGEWSSLQGPGPKRMGLQGYVREGGARTPAETPQKGRAHPKPRGRELPLLSWALACGPPPTRRFREGFEALESRRQLLEHRELKTGLHTEVCTPTFTKALSVMVPNWKDPNVQPLVSESTNRGHKGSPRPRPREQAKSADSGLLAAGRPPPAPDLAGTQRQAGKRAGGGALWWKRGRFQVSLDRAREPEAVGEQVSRASVIGGERTASASA